MIQQELELTMKTRGLRRGAQSLTKAILASDLDDVRQAAGQALLVSQRRKERFFVGAKNSVPDLE